MTNIIETENFYLRPLLDEDFDLLLNLRNHSDIRNMMESEVVTEEEMNNQLLRHQSRMRKLGFADFAIFTKQDDDFVGSAGPGLFHDPDGDRNPLSRINLEKYEYKDVELGYILHKKYWGKGYATEIAQACVNFIFNNYPDVQRMVAVTVLSNLKSQRVLQKIGFKFVKNVSSKTYGEESFFVLCRKDWD